jgi:hypothetical protein
VLDIQNVDIAIRKLCLDTMYFDLFITIRLNISCLRKYICNVLANFNCIMRSFLTSTLGQVKLDGQVKENETGRACSTNGAKRNAYRILVGKPEGKGP